MQISKKTTNYRYYCEICNIYIQNNKSEIQAHKSSIFHLIKQKKYLKNRDKIGSNTKENCAGSAINETKTNKSVRKLKKQDYIKKVTESLSQYVQEVNKNSIEKYHDAEVEKSEFSWFENVKLIPTEIKKKSSFLNINKWFRNVDNITNLPYYSNVALKLNVWEDPDSYISTLKLEKSGKHKFKNSLCLDDLAVAEETYEPAIGEWKADNESYKLDIAKPDNAIEVLESNFSTLNQLNSISNIQLNKKKNEPGRISRIKFSEV